jgi:glycosyltransferase involved in cell wall biosynthesis
MSTFVSNLARGFVLLGYEVYVVGLGDRVGCVRSGGVKSCSVASLRAGLEHATSVLAERCWELCDLVDMVVVNDYQCGLCVTACARRARTAFFVHLPNNIADNIVGALYPDALLFNSRLEARVFNDILRHVTSSRALEGVVSMPLQKVVYPAPPGGVARVSPGVWDDIARGFEHVVVFFTRGRDRHKNEQLAFQVAERLKGRGVLVVLAGIATCDQRGFISENLYCAGALTAEERNRLLSRADLHVLPSSFEPFGLVALEALKAGTPTVVSRNTGVAEVLPAPTFNPQDPDDAANVILHALKHRDEILERELNSWIMRRTWVDVAREIEEALTVITLKP